MLRYALVLVAACSSPAQDNGTLKVPIVDQQKPQPGEPDCAHAGDNIPRVLHLDGDRASAMAAVVEHHCRVDAWTAVAASCVAVAADHDAALQCAYKHLTEEQHDLVVKDMKQILPHDEDKPPERVPTAVHETGTPDPITVATKYPDGSQADIARRENDEGRDLMKKDKYPEASAKFRDAVARVPEPRYMFNLCVSLYQEGKFGEALVACHSVKKLETSADLVDKTDKMIAKITAEAKAQGIDVRP